MTTTRPSLTSNTGESHRGHQYLTTPLLSETTQVISPPPVFSVSPRISNFSCCLCMACVYVFFFFRAGASLFAALRMLVQHNVAQISFPIISNIESGRLRVVTSLKSFSNQAVGDSECSRPHNTRWK